VRITLLLARFAEADQQGTINALGLGWKACQGAMPAHALVIYLDIDWDETNQPHKLTADLLTADGQPVTISGPLGSQPVRFEAQVEAGRPPGATRGTAFRLPLAINIPGQTPLAPGRYEWRVVVEGFEGQAAVESFQVLPGPVQPPQPGAGSAQ
jgi:hypothetical protein